MTPRFRFLLPLLIAIFSLPATALFAAEAVVQPSTAGESFSSFFRYGVHHVIGGWDHLLFAAALVIALRSFWEVFKVIGVFTLAHSLTVTLVALKYVTPSLKVIEPLIAASIVIVALENIFFPDGAVSRRRLVIAFGFGLVHGLGLANALAAGMDGLSPTLIGWAIAAFCLGVEVGHLCVIGPLSGALKIGRDIGKEPFYRHTLRYGSLLIALGGCYFFLAALGKVPAVGG